MKTETKNAENATNAAAIPSASVPSIQVANPKPLAPWPVENPKAVDEAEYLNPTRPDDTNLDTLGQFARTAAKKGAEYAWELGRAVQLAKIKTQELGENFGDWRKKWIPDVNERSLQRYKQVGILDYDTVKGKTKGEVYKLLFGADYGGNTKHRNPVTALLKRVEDKVWVGAHRDELKILVEKLIAVLAD